jgi:hypothetical protein
MANNLQKDLNIFLSKKLSQTETHRRLAKVAKVITASI